MTQVLPWLAAVNVGSSLISDLLGNRDVKKFNKQQRKAQERANLINALGQGRFNFRAPQQEFSRSGLSGLASGIARVSGLGMQGIQASENIQGLMRNRHMSEGAAAAAEEYVKNREEFSNQFGGRALSGGLNILSGLHTLSGPRATPGAAEFSQNADELIDAAGKPIAVEDRPLTASGAHIMPETTISDQSEQRNPYWYLGYAREGQDMMGQQISLRKVQQKTTETLIGMQENYNYARTIMADPDLAAKITGSQMPDVIEGLILNDVDPAEVTQYLPLRLASAQEVESVSTLAQTIDTFASIKQDVAQLNELHPDWLGPAGSAVSVISTDEHRKAIASLRSRLKTFALSIAKAQGQGRLSDFDVQFFMDLAGDPGNRWASLMGKFDSTDEQLRISSRAMMQRFSVESRIGGIDMPSSITGTAGFAPGTSPRDIRVAPPVTESGQQTFPTGPTTVNIDEDFSIDIGNYDIQIPPGSRGFNNNNPGNLNFANQPHATLEPDNPRYGKGRFAVFPSMEMGIAQLHRQILLDAERGDTLEEFIHEYAPKAGGNDPERILQDLIQATGATAATPIVGINRQDLVEAIILGETGTTLVPRIGSPQAQISAINPIETYTQQPDETMLEFFQRLRKLRGQQ